MSTKLKITSWNINGIKSLTTPIKDILENLNSDIICFQETKSNEDNLNYKSALVEGYNSYFTFCQIKPGYSGVCIYCRNPIIPVSADEGFITTIKRLNPLLCDDISIRKHMNLSVEELQSLETEGRAICCEFQIKNCECGNRNENHSLFVLNVYCPMTDSENAERIKYKTLFNSLLQLCVDAILSHGSHIFLVGDINMKHKSIDIAELIPEEEFLTNYHRHWLDCLLIESQRCPKLAPLRPTSLPVYGRLVDTFRYLYPTLTDQYTCWNTKIGARITNFGTRIDFILCDASMLIGHCKLSDATILSDVIGSDHCPITATVDHLQLSPSLRLPSFCTINMRRFRNQSRITSFIVRSERPLKRTLENDQPLERTTDENQPLPVKAPRKAIEKSPILLNSQINDQWKGLFKKPEKPPRCSGHNCPCVQRTVTKEGPNKGKKFWCCSKSVGLANNPLSRCNYFVWSTG